MADIFKNLFNETRLSDLGADFGMPDADFCEYREQYLPEIGFRRAAPRRRPGTRTTTRRPAHRL